MQSNECFHPTYYANLSHTADGTILQSGATVENIVISVCLCDHLRNAHTVHGSTCMINHIYANQSRDSLLNYWVYSVCRECGNIIRYYGQTVCI